MRASGLVAILPSTVTRPAAISSRACDRLARPSFDSARSRATVPLAVVAKLEGDSEVLRAERLHGRLQIVLRGRADAHLVGLDRRLDLLQLRILQILDDVLGGFG